MKEEKELKNLMKAKSISFVGTGKNSGKTTAMNYIIKKLEKEKIGITSVGRDGESKDLVSGTDKPRIYLKKGNIVATTTFGLRNSDFSRKILCSTDFTTALGRVIIVELLSDGYVDLAGPSRVKDTKEVIDLLFEFGAKKVLIDGALDRVSSASPIVTEGVILSTGAPVGKSIDEIAKLTNSMIHSFSLKESHYNITSTVSIISKERLDFQFDSILHIDPIILDNLSKDSLALLINGPLTKSLYDMLIKRRELINNIELVVTDATKIFLTKNMMNNLKLSGYDLRVSNKAELLMVTINPKNLDGSFIDEIALKEKIKTDVKIVNVMREYEDL